MYVRACTACTNACATEAPPALHVADFNTKTPMQFSAQRARRHAPLQGLTRTAICKRQFDA